MRWRFADDTLEDLEAGVWHRPDCDEIQPEAVLVMHPIGSSVARDVAPRQCWTCQPEVHMVIGV